MLWRRKSYRFESTRTNRFYSVFRWRKKHPYGAYPAARRSRAVGKFKTANKTVLATLLLGLSFCVVIAAAICMIWVNDSPALDDDLCPNGIAPAAHITLILDLTDGLSEDQSQAYLEELALQQSLLQTGDRLSLYAIQADAPDQDARLVELFSRCRPRDGSQADFNFENPLMIKKRFKEQFVDPLKKAVAGIDPKITARSSPILSVLHKLAQTPGFTLAQRRELILFSNLMENSAQFSHYRSGCRNFQQVLNRSLRTLDVKDLLTGVDVTVFLIQNGQRMRGLADWWRQYFTYAGAAGVEFKNI